MKKTVLKKFNGCEFWKSCRKSPANGTASSPEKCRNPSHINGLIWGFYFGTPECHLSPNLLFTLFWSVKSDTCNLNRKVNLVQSMAQKGHRFTNLNGFAKERAVFIASAYIPCIAKNSAKINDHSPWNADQTRPMLQTINPSKNIKTAQQSFQIVKNMFRSPYNIVLA